MTAADLATAQWRISSFSGQNGTCVEVGVLADGRVAVRNSTRPDDGVVVFSRPELAAWIAGVKAGEFD